MKKILAIDDQQDNLTTIKALLKSRLKEIEIITATSGKEGLEKAVNEQPDTIILDIIMPVMDGYEVCLKLKKNDKTKHIPIILLTAIKTDSDSRVKGLMLGADAFLSKPIDPIELSTQVKVMLRIKNVEDQLRSENLHLEELIKDRTSKLYESEDYYRTLIENSTDYISILDSKGNIIQGIDHDKIILGYTSDELIGMNLLEMVHPDDLKGLKERIGEVLQGNYLYSTVTFRFLHKDGSWRYMEGTGKNMLNHPRIKGLVINYHDVTEQRKVELEKLESDRKMNTLIDNLQGIAYRCKIDKHWTMNYLSAGFKSITGYSVSDVIDNKVISYNEIIHPDDRENVRKKVNEALKNKATFEIQYRLINASGKIVYVYEKGIGIFNKQGEPINIEGFVADISETMLAREEISKLSMAVEQSPSIIVITDTQGKLVYANPKFTELTGYKQKELIGKKSNILKSGSQSDEIYKELWETITTGNTWKGEFHNKKKDGTLFWESASISPILDDNGTIIYYIKVAEDVTDRKKASKALDESESKYQKLIETSAEGFWLINEDGITQEVNDSLCRILGYNKDEIIGKKPYDFVDEENRKIFRAQINDANSRKQRTYEIKMTTKSGDQIPTRFNATSISDNEDNFIGSFAFVTDISKSKRDEQIQRVLYNISNIGITAGNLNEFIKQIQNELNKIIDTTNFFVALNDKETDTLLLPLISDEKDDIQSIPKGKTLTDYVIRTKKPLLANKKTTKELEQKGEIEQVGTDCKVWLGVPLMINNEVFGALVIQSYNDENAYNTTDMKMLEFVSEQISISINRKKDEEDIIAALEKATESDKLKTAFLQNISHEIRTPMNGIMGFTSLLKDSSLSGEEQQSYLDVIMISGKRMLNTLNDLMDMSMLETGQVKMNLCETNINSEFSILHEFFTLEVEKKGLEIHVNTPLPSEKVNILTDRDKFFAICTNLIKNAIKYSVEGRIDFGYEISGDFIKFYVKDMGLGIPEKRLDAIFERFVQADLEDVKVYEGTGLGLSISKAYIELLGGKIWVDSIEGKGSQFYFTLPYNPIIEDAKESTTKSLTTEKPKTKKYLIAEDEEFASEFLGIILEGPDTELLFAKNGFEAVDICRQNPDIDLILMDIKLPKMDGYTATAKIRTFNEKVPIIAQTAYALAGDREKALAAGCNEHITKPINKDLLLSIIEEKTGLK